MERHQWASRERDVADEADRAVGPHVHGPELGRQPHRRSGRRGSTGMRTPACRRARSRHDRYRPRPAGSATGERLVECLEVGPVRQPLRTAWPAGRIEQYPSHLHLRAGVSGHETRTSDQPVLARLVEADLQGDPVRVDLVLALEDQSGQAAALEARGIDDAIRHGAQVVVRGGVRQTALVECRYSRVAVFGRALPPAAVTRRTALTAAGTVCAKTPDQEEKTDLLR